jgi:hypothetical protein
MLYKETMAVCCTHHTEHMHSVGKQHRFQRKTWRPEYQPPGCKELLLKFKHFKHDDKITAIINNYIIRPYTI